MIVLPSDYPKLASWTFGKSVLVLDVLPFYRTVLGILSYRTVTIKFQRTSVQVFLSNNHCSLVNVRLRSTDMRKLQVSG